MNDYKGRPMTPLAEQVTQQAGTERPFTGLYTDVETPGIYRCIVCGATLFDSRAKFHSGCGWPSFDDAIDNKAVRLIEDTSHGMRRTEVRCAKCDAHLGHLFNDGPTATGQRFCINSVSIDLEEKTG